MRELTECRLERYCSSSSLLLQPLLTSSSAGPEAFQHGEDSQGAPGGRGRIQPWSVLQLYSSGDVGQLRGDVEASDGGREQRCPQDKCGSG